ncbi:MAG: hypothetical protein ACREA0_06215 [bacterium]
MTKIRILILAGVLVVSTACAASTTPSSSSPPSPAADPELDILIEDLVSIVDDSDFYRSLAAQTDCGALAPFVDDLNLMWEYAEATDNPHVNTIGGVVAATYYHGTTLGCDWAEVL